MSEILDLLRNLTSPEHEIEEQHDDLFSATGGPPSASVSTDLSSAGGTATDQDDDDLNAALNDEEIASFDLTVQDPILPDLLCLGPSRVQNGSTSSSSSADKHRPPLHRKTTSSAICSPKKKRISSEPLSLGKLKRVRPSPPPPSTEECRRCPR